MTTETPNVSVAAASDGAPNPAAMAAVLAVTLSLAAGCWVVAVRQAHGMNMGTTTQLGSFRSFIAGWVVMMAAMMLPGAAPALLRRVRAAGPGAAPRFVGGYLAVWALAGAVGYAAYRPHGTVAAAAVVFAAAAYELTPVKRAFRRRCAAATGSGLEYGLCCTGSTAGLMAMLLALGVMSITWMAVITVIVLAQKLLPAKAAVDLPVAVAMAGLGVLILIAPSIVPG